MLDINKKKFDFSGWATKYNERCKDGRIILPGTFKNCNGKVVPLVWNHNDSSPSSILGQVYLREDEHGVKAYGSFNKSSSAKDAAEALIHGDIEGLSINAKVKEDFEGKVSDGTIREVSLVLSGCNPGAFVESVFMHGEPMEFGDEECIIYSNDSRVNALIHSDPEDEDPEDEDPEDEDISDIIDSLTDKQKAAVAILIEQAATESDETGKKKKDEDISHSDLKNKEDVTMLGARANLFDQESKDNPIGGDSVRTFTHSDSESIVSMAKSKSMKLSEVYNEYIKENEISHADYSGMNYGTGNQTYGFRNPELLQLDGYQTDSGLLTISRSMEWVTTILSKVSKSPFSKVKSIFADITSDDARARGYIKGKLKKDEVITLLKRTIDATTIYKKQKIDRDDFIDITDMDIVPWLRSEMEVMLDEEKARAILLGDGRTAGAEDKIDETRIIPVIKDSELFTIKAAVEVSASATSEEISKAIIDTLIRVRRKYRGSGNPSMFTTEDYLGDILLLENAIGDKKYKTEQELATTLRVASIDTVGPMETTKVTIDDDELPLVAVIVNPIDYKVGSNALGKRNMFDQFDIDFNQQKYLIEERFSGGLIRPFSAIAIGLKKVSG